MLADTLVKIIVTAIIAAVMLLLWRSWREPFLVAVALVLEASVFITTTWIVGRHRPDVERLDTSPSAAVSRPDTSPPPSAYGAIAVVIFQRVRNPSLGWSWPSWSWSCPSSSALSRMYRGMHYLTDVIGGALLGAACVIVVTVIVQRSRRPRSAFGGPSTRDDHVGGCPGRRGAAVAVFGMSAVRAAARPVDPSPEERAVVRWLRRHPRLDRFLAERLDRRTAGGFLLTVAWPSASPSPSCSGSSSTRSTSSSRLAALDAEIAAGAPATPTSAAVDMLEVITHLGGRGRRRAPWWRGRGRLAACDATPRSSPSCRRDHRREADRQRPQVAIDRDRPDVMPLVSFDGASFPSGHTAAAAAAWPAVALILGRGRPRPVQALLAAGAALIAIAVAASRALLGVHWVTD